MVDEQLFRRYREASDEAAFEQLVRRRRPEVERLVARRVRDAQLADDLTQETFLRVARADPELEERGAFRRWLRTVASNVVRSWADADARRRTHLARAGAERRRAEPPEGDPLHRLRLREVQERLQRLPRELVSPSRCTSSRG